MTKKKGRSEKKTDWLGRSYIQHYDSKGNKSGRSERKETFFGRKYTQHSDARGEKTGRSEQKETWTGKTYTQKYNSKGEKSGKSEKKEGWFGNKYTQHYDAKGNKTDWSERKETFFGKRYVQRYGDETNATPPASRTNRGTGKGVHGFFSSSYSPHVTSASTGTAGHSSRKSEDSSARASTSLGRAVIVILLSGLALFAVAILLTRQPGRPPAIRSVVNFASTYTGRVDKKYKVEMNLRQEGNNLSGTYVYSKYNIPIELRGTVDEANNVLMYGYDRKGTLIDVFEGTINGNSFSGTFTRQKDLKKMPFQLTRKS